jgi:uncharacterized membrane protein
MDFLAQFFSRPPLVADPFSVLIVSTLGIAFSYWLEGRFRWARRVGNVIILITVGLLLSNLRVVPFESVVYDEAWGIGLNASIALLLLRLDISDLRKLDKQCVGYFLLCCVGTITGAITAHLVFGDLIGEESWKLVGQLTASYIGGGENAAAVGRALEVNNQLFTSVFAADNIVTAIWMLLCLSGPVGLGRFFSTTTPMEISDAPKDRTKPFTTQEFLPSLFYSLATAGIILWGAGSVATFFKFHPSSSWFFSLFNGIGAGKIVLGDFLHYILGIKIIWVTTLAIAVAQTPFKKHFKVSYLLGTLLFNYFFFSMGAISSFAGLVERGPGAFAYVTTIVAIHGIIVLGVGKLIHANLPKLLTASQATIGGPATAAALAEANNWPHLVIPGVLMGILGYATANYIGFIIALLVRGL